MASIASKEGDIGMHTDAGTGSSTSGVDAGDLISNCASSGDGRPRAFGPGVGGLRAVRLHVAEEPNSGLDF